MLQRSFNFSFNFMMRLLCIASLDLVIGPIYILVLHTTEQLSTKFQGVNTCLQGAAIA